MASAILPNARRAPLGVRISGGGQRKERSIEDAFPFRPINGRCPDIAELECLVEQRDLHPVLAGQALAMIRDRELYRSERGCAAFEGYCQHSLALGPERVQSCLAAADQAGSYPELEGMNLVEIVRWLKSRGSERTAHPIPRLARR